MGISRLLHYFCLQTKERTDPSLLRLLLLFDIASRSQRPTTRSSLVAAAAAAAGAVYLALLRDDRA